MSEKTPISGIEFGVEPPGVLARRAMLHIEKDSELEAIPNDEAVLVPWLLAYYKERIYPDYYDAWQMTLGVLLDEAPIEAIAQPSIEQWFTSYVPPLAAGQWHQGLLRATLEVSGPTDYHQAGRYELDRLKTLQDYGMVVDGDDFRSRVRNAFELSGADIRIEPFELSDGQAQGYNQHRECMLGDKYGYSHGNIHYFRPTADDPETRYVDANGDPRQLRPEELTRYCADAWANAQILREFGYVIKNTGRKIEEVTPITTS